MSFYVPTATNHEWRRLDILTGEEFEDESSNASHLMMSLAADSNGKTTFDLSYDNTKRFKFQQGEITYLDGASNNILHLDEDRVWAKTLTTEGDLTVGGADIWIGSSQEFDHTKRASRIQFKDSNSNAFRTLQWNDDKEEFRVDDNTGTDHSLLHTGNAASYLLNDLQFDDRFVNTTGDTIQGNLRITSLYQLQVDKISVIGEKGFIVNTGESAGKVTGQNDAWMYVNSEFGLKITTPSTEGVWAGNSIKRTSYITGTKGYFGSNRMFADDYHPNADQLTTARTISLKGDASGSVSFDGSKNVELTVAIADDSHRHVISDIDGLSTLADGKVDIAGDTMTGKLTINVSGEALRVKDTSGSGNPEIRLYQNTTLAGTLKYYNSGTVFAIENNRSSSSIRIVNSTSNGLTHRHLSGSNSVDATILTTSNIGSVGNSIMKDTTAQQQCIGNVQFQAGLIIGKTGNSYINFIDANSSSAQRSFGWQNSGNDWYGEDNSGNMRLFWHSGNTGTLFATLDTRYALSHSHPYLNTAGGTITGDLTVNGTIYGKKEVWAHYSDERLKTDITTIDSPIEKVNKLTGFYYKENELAKSLGCDNDQRQVGISAQDVKSVLPEAVGLAPVDIIQDENGDIKSKSGEDYLTVNYAKIVPLLIESIKELSAEVEKLKQELKI
jgi:hypothetical protein